jgi:hypothetical protein
VPDLFGLTPDAAGFVHISAERHPIRFVAKGRDENRDEFVLVITGDPEEAPSYLALSLDDARRLVKHLFRVLDEPPARLW